MARRKKKAENRKRNGSCARTLIYATWKLLLVLLVLSLLQVGCTKFVDPPATTMMAQRWLEAKLAHRQPPPIRQQWLALEDVPADFLRMLLVSEDARYFDHHGFDLIELEAAWTDYTEKGKPLRGASTVSMQCARSLFLWQGRSRVRKVLEAYYTVLMELLLDKRRILELYVNHIELGDGVYGLDAASNYHFGKAPSQLTRNQLACLAAMLPNPRHWNPANPDNKLAARRERILQRFSTLSLPEAYQ